MKNCPNCNASVPDMAKFCPKCRFNIKKYEDEQVNSVLYCMECGVEILEGASFCMECGADVASSDNTSSVVGGNPLFGSYYQSSTSTKEPIEWIVLAREDNKALLISKYALDCKPYNTENTGISWETCSLRKWLNNEFLNTAFSKDEQEKIQTTYVQNPNNTQYSTSEGFATEDKIFLLSVDEARKYFSNDEARMCKPTNYAISTRVYKTGDGYCYWWLLPRTNFQINPAFVYNFGKVANDCDVHSVGVRPALWKKYNSSLRSQPTAVSKVTNENYNLTVK